MESVLTTRVMTTTSHTQSNGIHFLPPKDDDTSTAWIVVGVVVGTILAVFVIILVVRQLIIMFGHRHYESISNSPSCSDKSIFDHYDNGQLHINMDSQLSSRGAHSVQMIDETNEKRKAKKRDKQQSPRRDEEFGSSDPRNTGSTVSRSGSRVYLVDSSGSEEEDHDQGHLYVHRHGSIRRPRAGTNSTSMGFSMSRTRDTRFSSDNV